MMEPTRPGERFTLVRCSTPHEYLIADHIALRYTVCVQTDSVERETDSEISQIRLDVTPYFIYGRRTRHSSHSLSLDRRFPLPGLLPPHNPS